MDDYSFKCKSIELYLHSSAEICVRKNDFQMILKISKSSIRQILRLILTWLWHDLYLSMASTWHEFNQSETCRSAGICVRKIYFEMTLTFSNVYSTDIPWCFFIVTLTYLWPQLDMSCHSKTNSPADISVRKNQQDMTLNISHASIRQTASLILSSPTHDSPICDLNLTWVYTFRKLHFGRNKREIKNGIETTNCSRYYKLMKK